MGEKTEDRAGLQEEHDRIKAETEAQMVRSRVNDYIAIALALGAVLILWILQLMGLY
jgi:thiamine monophosphate synthase